MVFGKGREPPSLSGALEVEEVEGEGVIWVLVVVLVLLRAAAAGFAICSFNACRAVGDSDSLRRSQLGSKGPDESESESESCSLIKADI